MKKVGERGRRDDDVELSLARQAGGMISVSL